MPLAPRLAPLLSSVREARHALGQPAAVLISNAELALRDVEVLLALGPDAAGPELAARLGRLHFKVRMMAEHAGPLRGALGRLNEAVDGLAAIEGAAEALAGAGPIADPPCEGDEVTVEVRGVVAWVAGEDAAIDVDAGGSIFIRRVRLVVPRPALRHPTPPSHFPPVGHARLNGDEAIVAHEARP